MPISPSAWRARERFECSLDVTGRAHFDCVDAHRERRRRISKRPEVERATRCRYIRIEGAPPPRLVFGATP